MTMKYWTDGSMIDFGKQICWAVDDMAIWRADMTLFAGRLSCFWWRTPRGTYLTIATWRTSCGGGEGISESSFLHSTAWALPQRWASFLGLLLDYRLEFMHPSLSCLKARYQLSKVHFWPTVNSHCRSKSFTANVNVKHAKLSCFW